MRSQMFAAKRKIIGNILLTTHRIWKIFIFCKISRFIRGVQEEQAAEELEHEQEQAAPSKPNGRHDSDDEETRRERDKALKELKIGAYAIKGMQKRRGRYMKNIWMEG